MKKYSISYRRTLSEGLQSHIADGSIDYFLLINCLQSSCRSNFTIVICFLGTTHFPIWPTVDRRRRGRNGASSLLWGQKADIEVSGN